MIECRVCKLAQDSSRYRRSSTRASGRRSECRTCENAYKRESRKRKGGLRNVTRRGVQPIVILSDVHVPDHDHLFWRAALAWIKDHRPCEVIISGDFGEYGSVSQHGTNETKLLEDLASVKQALDQLREAAGEDCDITYLEGNHESRFPRAIATWAPTFKDAMDLPGLLGLQQRGVKWVPEYDQPIRRGLLRVLHGHQVLGKYGPKHHAAKAADVYGSATHSEVVYGHVHAAQQFSKAVIGGYVSASSVGCGRTIGADKVRWLAGREAGWHHGFGVAYATDTMVQFFNVKVRDGRFIWNGRVYDGAAKGV